MRGTLLSAILLIIAVGMMGCIDITPCTVDEDCAIDYGWGDKDAARDWDGPSMVCNLEVSALEACEEMLSYLPPLDWLPMIGDWITLPDCTELYADVEEPGSCESSWGMGWF